MKGIRQILLLISFFSITLFHCTTNVAEGSGHDWEAKICGFIQDKNGIGIDSVTIRLLPANFIPVPDPGFLDVTREDTLNCFSTITGENGEFLFPSIKMVDTYVLSGTLVLPDTFFAYHPDIVVNEQDINNGDSIDVGIVIPGKPAHVIFHVPNNLYDTTGVLYVPGTEFKQKVDSVGAVTFNVPAGTIDIHYAARDSTGTFVDTTIASNITLSENEEIIIGVPVTIPGFNGPDTVVVDSPFTYSIINHSDSLLYRFVWEEGDTTSWTDDSLFTHTWNNTGSTTIFAQACLQIDVTKQSTWSSGKQVVIKPMHTISKPVKPWTINDSILTGDSTLFTTRGAVSNYNHAVQYQFAWGDSILSAWSFDTTASYRWNVIGTFYISARARSSIDTTVLSEYSDLLLITVSSYDTIPPVITLLGANPINLYVGNTYIEPGATAIDDVDGDISGKIQISGTVNTSDTGDYTLNYSVSDDAGNNSELTREVTVADSTVRLNSIYENPVNRNGYNAIGVVFPYGKNTKQRSNSNTIQMIEPINTNKTVEKTE